MIGGGGGIAALIGLYKLDVLGKLGKYFRETIVFIKIYSKI